MSLRVTWSTTTHALSLVVRVRDHFGGGPVPDTLAVSLPGTEVAPVRAASGGERHPDGTYRFAGVPDGTWPLLVEDPAGRWRFDAAFPSVTLPLAAPAVPVEIEARPTPAAAVPVGVTVLRGRVLDDASGAPVAGAQVRIDAPSGAFTRVAHADADGEFLFLVTWPVPLDARRRLALEARVTSPARTVASAEARPDPAAAGPTFSVAPATTSRLFLRTTP